MAKAIKMRVIIPTNTPDLLNLAKNVFTKHQLEKTASPLNNMQDHHWDIDGPKVDQALVLHRQAEDLRLQMEKAYRDRDLLITAIKETVLASRDVLSGVYRSNMKRMGDWGFTVDDTPKAAKTSKKAP